MGLPTFIPDDVAGDWLGHNVGRDDAANVITLTISGLDNALAYTVTVGAANNLDNNGNTLTGPNAADTTWSVDGGSAQTTVATVGSEAYVTFDSLVTGGDGTLPF